MQLYTPDRTAKLENHRLATISGQGCRLMLLREVNNRHSTSPRDQSSVEGCYNSRYQLYSCLLRRKAKTKRRGRTQHEGTEQRAPNLFITLSSALILTQLADHNMSRGQSRDGGIIEPHISVEGQQDKSTFLRRGTAHFFNTIPASNSLNGPFAHPFTAPLSELWRMEQLSHFSKLRELQIWEVALLLSAIVSSVYRLEPLLRALEAQIANHSG